MSTFETSTRPFDDSNATSWNKAIAVDSWSTEEEQNWFYKEDQTVVVTAIQPSRDIWKEEDMRRIIPKLRHLRVRN